MEIINDYIAQFITDWTWADYFELAVGSGLCAYFVYRIECKINPLVQRVNELTESNEQALQLIDQQDAEIRRLQQRVQDLHYKQIEENAIWQDWDRSN